MSQFRNLVFKGGGVKGVAYIGAIELLEKAGIISDILRVCGTSSGAVMAAHIALGGSAEQLSDFMSSRFLKSLLDKATWPGQSLTRLITEYGWFNGKRLSLWLKRHVEDLTGEQGLTFARLAELSNRHPHRFKELTVVATNVTLQCPHVLSFSTTPDVPVWEALRASMSIPFLFSAAKLGADQLYVDGGLTWNYPLSYYDDEKWLSREGDSRLYAFIEHPSQKNEKRFYNKETLGLMVETRTLEQRLASMKFDAKGEIDSFPSYLKAMLGLMTDVTASNFLNLPDWQRTIFIEANGVRATDFDLSPESIYSLIESGRKSTRAYLEWFQNSEKDPLNRIDKPVAAQESQPGQA